MADHPILFSAPMVRALLAGTKTQTRRVVKPQPTGFVGGPGITLADGSPAPLMPLDETIEPYGRVIRCPYGQPGDRLWVRETWYFEGTDMMRHGRTHSTQDGVVRYLADGARRTINTHWEAVERWMTRKPQNRPGIHMPRWASRITLEVTGVRVERLQEISEADAIAEGVNVHPDHHGRPRTSIYSPVEAYRDLWESINGQGSWEVNPWVWVVSFKRVTP